MADEGPPQEKGPKGQKTIVIAVVIIVLTATVGLFGYSLQKINSISSGTEDIFSVTVEIGSEDKNPFIKSIDPSIKEIDKRDVVRKDVVVYPGVSLVVRSGSKIINYNSFAEMSSTGKFTINSAFRSQPMEGEILIVTVILYPDPEGGYPGDGKRFYFHWSQDSSVRSVRISSELDIGSEAVFSNTTAEIGPMINTTGKMAYNGLHAYARIGDQLISPQVSVPVTGSGPYTIDIPVTTPPAIGEEISIVLEYWIDTQGYIAEDTEVTYAWS